MRWGRGISETSQYLHEERKQKKKKPVSRWPYEEPSGYVLASSQQWCIDNNICPHNFPYRVGLLAIIQQKKTMHES